MDDENVEKILDLFGQKLDFLIERIELLRKYNELKAEINGLDHLTAEHNYVGKFPGLGEQREKIEKQLRRIQKGLKINRNELNDINARIQSLK